MFQRLVTVTQLLNIIFKFHQETKSKQKMRDPICVTAVIAWKWQWKPKKLFSNVFALKEKCLSHYGSHPHLLLWPWVLVVAVNIGTSRFHSSWQWMRWPSDEYTRSVINLDVKACWTIRTPSQVTSFHLVPALLFFLPHSRSLFWLPKTEISRKYGKKHFFYPVEESSADDVT